MTLVKSVLFVCLASLIHAQNRVERPLQVQANLSGGFFGVAGSAFTDHNVGDLKVNKWLPGFSIGYHLNRYFYFGYTFSPSMDLTLREHWGFNSQSKDGNIVLGHKTGAMNSFDSRISPFDFGLYLSLSYLIINEVHYDMKFRRTGDEMYIGSNQYDTDLDVRWNSQSTQRVALGFGYNHVFGSGWSFNLGLTLPLGFPGDKNIRYRPVNSTNPSILVSDLELASRRIQKETFYRPLLLFVSTGYNFSLDN